MEAHALNRKLAGRYALAEVIAQGGMATVWRARDEVLARQVAVKLLREELAGDPEFAQRFQREAVAAARLTHPSIISVFDTGVEEGSHYIVMEYFEGRTLQQVLAERGRLEPGEAAELGLAVLAALRFAHAAGLIHRDVKPANILVGEDARVKVTDFGIAKAAFADGDLTTTGAVLGTVRYLSPEQVRGDEVDPRSDLYSLGVVLYELVTGRPPFQAENEVATAMIRLTRDPLPPRAVRAGIPKDLESVILRAMARRPEDRFRSAEAMQGVLQRFLAGGRPTRPLHIPVPLAAPEEEPADSGVSFFRSWMLVPLILLLLAGAAIAAGVGIGRLKLGGPLGVRPAPQGQATPTTAPVQISIVGGRDYDPEGKDGSEHPGEVPLAFDGNPGTAWRTDHYRSARFGNLKQGVGLWLDLGQVTKVDRVTIRSPLTGWTFELKAGTLEKLSGPLEATNGSATFEVGTSGRNVINLRSEQARGLLIWITGLAADAGGYAAAVGEVSVAGSTG